MSQVSWEEAVRWYRLQPDNQAMILANYFDLPVRTAVERYARSEEFAEVLRLLGPGNGRAVLDLGAGNGIASYALARAGWQVTALEPDPSDEVGAGAIRGLRDQTGLPITVTQEWGESLPFAAGAFDAMHGRQVLHHARDLEAMVREVARVLRPGGRALFTREHVVDDDAQLAAFRAAHPLHHLYGGESAFPLQRYQTAFRAAGLRLRRTWGPAESILNYFPGSEAQRLRAVRRNAGRSLYRLGWLLVWWPWFRAEQLRRTTLRDHTPGRIYSFLLEKP